ncbi:MAG: type II secretion system F family protein [Armatimonadetes bacterium]|nr:MAG: type II secretion system F family protein [Armatimonadota bacterium]
MAKTFSFIAIDRNGSRTTGVIEAPSEKAARDRLVGQGYLVEFLQEGKAAKPGRPAVVRHVVGPMFGRVNLESLERFFAQLHSMYKAGVHLHQALETLGENSRHPVLRSVIRDLKTFVLEGRMMSEGMEKYPEVFTPLQVSLVRAGERGGTLERSLKEISEYLKREIKLRNQIKRATFYPKLILAVLIVLPLVANAAVSAIAARTGGPAFTILSITSSIWFWVFAGFVLFFWLFFSRVLLPIPAVRWVWDLVVVVTPYVGSTIRMLTMARFARAFGALYGGGIPLATSVVLAADACGNEYLRRRMYPAARMIQEGRTVTEAFASTHAFTPVTLDMTATGEKSGNLDSILDHVAEQYEDEAEVRLEKMPRVLGVLLLLIAGAVVAYIVVSFYTQYINAIQDAAS